jgi:uncharacterized protein YodC (DUF2158 family)
MTVQGIDPYGNVDCQWFVGGKLHHGSFPPESLVVAED